jgi:hypothetical protein
VHGDLHEAIDHLLAHEGYLTWERKETVLAWKLSILTLIEKKGSGSWLGPRPDLIMLPPRPTMLMSLAGHHIGLIDQIPSEATLKLLRSLSHEMVFTFLGGLVESVWVHTAIDELLGRSDLPDRSVAVGWKLLLQWHLGEKAWLGPRGIEKGLKPKVEPEIDESEYNESEFNENLFKRVDELEFSVRVQNCLQNANIEFVYQLVEKREAEVLDINNLGRQSLNNIKEVLQDLILSLGMKLHDFPSGTQLQRRTQR